jgi:mannose-6-phosphate isomerase-like protein (cupin superfamily)
MRETIIRHRDAPRFGDEGTEITGYASPTRGSVAVSAWKVVLHPGAASPVHQLTDTEAFIALRGRGTFAFDDRTHELGAGDAICVPASTPFHLANAGDEPFEAICCMAATGQGQVGDGEPFTPPWAA